jgi:diguanylate cyclase (GGDEF)-like protein/PAS domain S-box-containing protein
MTPSVANSTGASTLLIVDDLPENLSLLEALLRTAGYLVRAANSGAVALRYAALTPAPSLILLDVMMPEMDGHEVLRQLRAQAATRDIPVIFLTALDDPENIVRGLQLGAADYITKPIQPEVVLARVRNQLEAAFARLLLKDQNAALETEVSRRLSENLRIREESERARAQLNRQRELILSSAAEGIFGMDTEGVINFINPAAVAMLAYEGDQLLGRKAREILRRSDPGTAPADGDDCLLSHSCMTGTATQNQEAVLLRRDGSHLPIEVSCTPIVEEGRHRGAVVTLQDISERKRYREQLERRSNFDELTGLPNRNLLNDRLAQAIARHRESGGAMTVLLLNLDRFKSINDSLGHGAADTMLKEVGTRLGEHIRETDTLARLEGDEFVLVTESPERDAVAKLAQPVLAALSAPFRVGEREFFVTASLGLALYPKDGSTGEALLRNASAAMYKAKAEGGGRFQFYTAEMNARSLERLELENDLRSAIKNDELIVHYQPQLNLRTGDIIGAEALVRWQHPRRGLVPPGDFIPLAEASGLIVPLGEWVLRTACRQNKAWQDAGLPPLRVAVNLSPRQLVGQDIVALTRSVLRETGLPPTCLELELTESAVMADAEAFIQSTQALKKLSVKISIDDFGTGYSSLNHLHRFAVDRLKIDASFVRDITQNSSNSAIALAIISLAHTLKLSVIAEGVETEAQLNFLRNRHCDEMQGFYFSKAVPAVAFEQMLRERRKLVFSSSSTSPSRTLLVVDDEPAILAALKRVFRREGYNVLTATGGSDGLNLLATHRIGVVISDSRMPQMSGAEFLGKVRDIHPDTVRIMLSGYTDLEAVTRAVNRGELFHFLGKPWDDAELLEIVRDAFRHHELRQQHPAPSNPDPAHA